jgi:hypothetical protein
MQHALMSTVTNMATVHFEIMTDNLAYTEFVFIEIIRSTGLLKLYEVFPRISDSDKFSLVKMIQYLFYQHS